MLYDLSIGKEVDGEIFPLSFNNATFMNGDSMVLEECPISFAKEVSNHGNCLEIEVRSTSMSFCENPMATIDFNESNI